MTTDPTPTPAAWIDGDPLMEAIAAAVWKQCRTEHPSSVVDDPRNIAAVAASVARAAVSAVAPATDRAAAPVKQRADCTELEWAVQERARFERLYTRETVRADLAEQRADTAARDAGIYQKRLERLGEGYTEQRKRAEAMERAMESTAADALAHRGCHRDLMAQCPRAERAEAEVERLRADRAAACICGHTEAQHFEDACLVCDCGDYLTAGAAREVIDRQRKTADQAGEFTAADLVAALRGAGAERDKIEAQARATARAIVLREAEAALRARGKRLAGEYNDSDILHEDGPAATVATWKRAAEVVGRMAAESVPAVIGHTGDETQDQADDYERTTGHLITCFAVAGGNPDPDCPCAAAAQQPKETRPSPTEELLATRCDACRHTLNRHFRHGACTVVLCVCGTFQYPVEELPQ
jgi:hypothetical protein